MFADQTQERGLHKASDLIPTTALGSKHFCLHSSEGRFTILVESQGPRDTGHPGERKAGKPGLFTACPLNFPAPGAADRTRLRRAEGGRAGCSIQPRRSRERCGHAVETDVQATLLSQGLAPRARAPPCVNVCERRVCRV